MPSKEAKNAQGHPGPRIRREILPKGMAVTEVASLLGVGRPALSNLLNAKAALSAEMAARLEKAFGCSSKGLLQMQADYDAEQARLRSPPADAKRYVPPFLGIKANQIEQWVTRNIHARSRFAVFLRVLINSTARELRRVDFPGNDDAERPGWDGFVEANDGTPWIPAGCSGWEFGTNSDVGAKAKSDFEKSTKAMPSKERAGITFVFVTPRHWPGKSAWVDTAKQQKRWKDVRAYDASDLEQWLEQSLPAQSWFADETDLPEREVRSLDRCWWEWAQVSTPALASALFGAAVEAAKRTMRARLASPSKEPTVIAADSTEEALAFLAQLFSDEEFASQRDKVLVFDKPGVLPRLAQGSPSFIAVVHSREVERELGPYAGSLSAIIIYPRNVSNAEHHVVLEPVSHETFARGLESMGKNRDEVLRLADESGRSLTVLRRRLAAVPAVRLPEWAAQHDIATSLIPFLLVGRWSIDNAADTTALTLLAADKPFDELERDCHRLIQLNDAPLWSIGPQRGVVSKIDLLFAIANAVTRDDLKQYFVIAQIVLGEDDPSLDLDESQRWAAALYGKRRQFSSAFRDGISETLVLLALHGAHLFGKRLGIDTGAEAARLVRQLLATPLTKRRLEANERDLPTYAEAAPTELLSILEHDLREKESAVISLMRPVASGNLGHPGRTGLLWALEALAWSPKTLPRAAAILARLAQIEIKDNWVNKPINSLQGIFRAALPQTLASPSARLDLLKSLAGKFPDVMWEVCMAQLRSGYVIGFDSYKPRWRLDGNEFGKTDLSGASMLEYRHGVIDLVLAWKEHGVATLSGLVERLQDLDDEHQIAVWALIGAWADIRASDEDKAVLREKIRVSVLSRRAAARARGRVEFSALTNRAKEAYAALEPNDLINRHAWLFRDAWVEESADEIEEIDASDYAKRAERIQEMRTAALCEIHSELGNLGLILVAEVGRAAWQVGLLAARQLLTESQLRELLEAAIRDVANGATRTAACRALIGGALRGIASEFERQQLLRMLFVDLGEDDKVRLVLVAPFDPATWELVDAMSAASRDRYWREVAVDRLSYSSSANMDAIERLVEAGRPRAAFSCIRLEPEKWDTRVLFRLLWEMVRGGPNEHPSELSDHHDIERAFQVLTGSAELTLEEKAGLEFAYIGVLATPGDFDGVCRTPSLQQYIDDHPEFYVQSIVWSYRRSDGGSDPAELEAAPERRKHMAERGQALRETLTRIPGNDEFGVLCAERLAAWVAIVRQSCAALGRSDVADVCIGELLARAPVGTDGAWPCEPVRQVMEDIQSDKLMHGAHVGKYNMRGMHVRGEGGDQERQLADQYRGWAHDVQMAHPYVASQLLLELANTYDREAADEDVVAGVGRRRR